MPPRRPPASPRLIRRYDNRKLYDVAAKRYVAIEDLARLITAGEDVHVQDQRTGDDITSVVLAQVVLDRVRERTDSIPRQVLTRLIRLGAGPVSAWADWDGPHEAAARARAEAERIAADVAASVHGLVAEAQGSVESRLRQWLPRGHSSRPRSPKPSATKSRPRARPSRAAVTQQKKKRRER